MLKKALIIVGLLALLVGLPLWSKYNRGGDAQQVELETASRSIIKSSILASGTLAYREQVQLRSEVIAQVTKVHVKEADRVSRGDLLISLNTETYDAQVEQAMARVRMQEIAIDRQQLLIENLERRHRNAAELMRKKLVDEDSFANLSNDVEIARVDLASHMEGLSQASAALAQSQDLLSKTRILSPIDGLVIQVEVKAGETVIAGTTNIPGSTLMVVADPSEMLAEVRVDEADIAQVREGQKADIFAAAFPDRPLHGTVESIATTARSAPGQQSLSFLVKILLEKQKELAVRSGMSGRAEIYTQTSEETLAVPIQAVLYDDEEALEEERSETYVLVFDDGIARRRDVAAGVSSDSHQEILSGLNDGEQVISGPFRVLRHLSDGDPVKERTAGDQDD